MNVRALHFVVLELLRGFVDEIVLYEDLMKILESVVRDSFSRTLGK